MKAILIGALGTLFAASIGAAAVLYLGWGDVAADVPHTPVVFHLLEFARERSIARHARDIVPPPDFGSAERVRRGAGNYDAMCVHCHLAPGVENSEIRRGLYPRPPNLSRAADTELPRDRLAARRFWVVKHGLKATGMPAWGRGGMDDGDVWDLVSFVGVLPTLSAAQYHREVEASAGHVHGGAKPHTH